MSKLNWRRVGYENRMSRQGWQSADQEMVGSEPVGGPPTLSAPLVRTSPRHLPEEGYACPYCGVSMKTAERRKAHVQSRCPKRPIKANPSAPRTLLRKGAGAAKAKPERSQKGGERSANLKRSEENLTRRHQSLIRAMTTHLAELEGGDNLARRHANVIVSITRGLFKLSDDDLNEISRLVEHLLKSSPRKR